jgi:hypothetical protein
MFYSGRLSQPRLIFAIKDEVMDTISSLLHGTMLERLARDKHSIYLLGPILKFQRK